MSAKHGKMRVSVLFGGESNEHEVSCASGEQVIRQLNPARYHIRPVFISKQGKWHIPSRALTRSWTFSTQAWIHPPLLRTCSNNITDIAQTTDVAFLALHGRFGEDGAVQGLLDVIGVPYTGSGVLASSLAFHKLIAKQIYENNNIPTPPYMAVDKRVWQQQAIRLLRNVQAQFGFPCVAKAVQSGSSCDMGIPQNQNDLKKILRSIFTIYQEVLIEKFIEGKEFSCSVLDYKAGPRALPPTLIVPKASTFFDYTAKYEPGASEEITPAPISSSLCSQIQELSIRSHQALQCDSYSRTDLLCKNGRLFVLETNTLPGMTRTSLLPQQAAAGGISYPRLLDQIIRNVRKREIS